MEYSPDQELKDLIEQREKVNTRIKELTLLKYEKYQNSKNIVKDDNPYSRLMALERMGVV